jgi:hypothetical protein
MNNLLSENKLIITLWKKEKKIKNKSNLVDFILMQVKNSDRFPN